jgi:hypothetical protein
MIMVLLLSPTEMEWQVLNPGYLHFDLSVLPLCCHVTAMLPKSAFDVQQGGIMILGFI